MCLCKGTADATIVAAYTENEDSGDFLMVSKGIGFCHMCWNRDWFDTYKIVMNILLRCLIM